MGQKPIRPNVQNPFGKEKKKTTKMIFPRKEKENLQEDYKSQLGGTPPLWVCMIYGKGGKRDPTSYIFLYPRGEKRGGKKSRFCYSGPSCRRKNKKGGKESCTVVPNPLGKGEKDNKVCTNRGRKEERKFFDKGQKEKGVVEPNRKTAGSGSKKEDWGGRRAMWPP